MILRSRTKRLRERESGKDRISELPEHLIHHIFSFLHIKCIVSTSLLSTKWRYLWTTIPIIELHNWRPPCKSIGVRKTNAFVRFVDRVLAFRLDAHSPPIKKFCLDCHDDFDASRVHRWISTVLQRKIEELVLTASMLSSIFVPPCLFTCESLTSLEINMHSYLTLPESVYFPKLKILRLGVRLKNENFIQKLLSSSPVLEELSMEVPYWDIQHLSILGPNLKRLFITGTYHQNFDVQITAPNLQSFKYYSSFIAEDFILHNFLALHDAEIDLSRSVGKRGIGELGYLTTKLFHSISYVKRLTVSDYSLKLLYQGHLQTSLPSFCNLIHLEVNIGGWYVGYGCGNKEELLYFLHISPNLESLIFAEGYRNYEFGSNYGYSLDLIPQCLSLHLKSIEFRGFFGTQVEMGLLKLFLKNAKVLRRVRITISSQSRLSTNSNYKKKVVDKIALFPRGSPECVLHVS